MGKSSTDSLYMIKGWVGIKSGRVMSLHNPRRDYEDVALYKTKKMAQQFADEVAPALLFIGVERARRKGGSR